MRAETLVCLGGPMDRRTVTIESDRWAITTMHAPPMTRADVHRDGEIRVDTVTYERVRVQAGEATMTARGARRWDVLLPAGASALERTVLWHRDERPVVDGGHRTPRWGQPGNGCPNPDRIHEHWCGSCGRRDLFSRIQCRALKAVPACPGCGERDWRTEVDERTLALLDVVA